MFDTKLGLPFLTLFDVAVMTDRAWRVWIVSDSAS